MAQNHRMSEAIDGVIVRPLTIHRDARGWLCECYRRDECSHERMPAMAYLSVTLPGVARGPHEHRLQTDYFVFLGPSDFCLYLWDNRPSSPTVGRHMTFVAGHRNPCAVTIPPGIAHAYRNIGSEPGLVFCAPNRLYRGEGKRESADEIRYEDIADSPFTIPPMHIDGV